MDHETSTPPWGSVFKVDLDQVAKFLQINFTYLLYVFHGYLVHHKYFKLS